MRLDQELACDAAASAKLVMRRDYANALLKSQIKSAALPLGCNWPGSEHPLIERIALLKRKPVNKIRRIAGAGLVVFAAVFAGLGTWAAQPPVPAKSVPAPLGNRQMESAESPVPNVVATQNNVSDMPEVSATPIGSDAMAGLRTVRVTKQASVAALPSDAALVGGAAVQADPSQAETAAQQSPDIKVALNGPVANVTADTATAGAAEQVLPVSVVAKPLSARGLTADDVVVWLQSQGYTAHTSSQCYDAFLVCLPAGREPVILSYADHHLFFIHLHDCKDGRCTVMQFLADMQTMNPQTRRTATPESLAKWNSTNSGPQAFFSGPLLVKDALRSRQILDPALQFDLQLLPGATYEQLSSRLTIWHASLDKFYDFIELGP